MPPPSQKQALRPIAFILHNQAENLPPVVVPLIIRPEDLTRTDTSRLSVAQTMDGAWADCWGEGLPSAQISGTSGWGQNDRPSGEGQFKLLFDTVFTKWHADRAAQVKKGGDPDKVRLLFADSLDSFVWVIAPQQFLLRRSKSRPLLSQYQISFVQTSTEVDSTLKAIAESDAVKQAKGLDSLDQALTKIKSFIADLKTGVLGTIIDGIKTGIGTVRKAVAAFAQMTYDALTLVKTTISSGRNLFGDIPADLMNIGGNLSRAAANILHTYRSIVDLPLIAQAKFARAASAFENAYCILSNLLSARHFLPDYNTLYGSANCSSTAGGYAISRYDTENPFPALTALPQGQGQAPWYTGTGLSSLNTLAGADTVLYPQSAADILRHMNNVNSGMGIF